MLNNTAVKNLLRKNKDAFRIMHSLYDFDFEKDFSIVEQSGRFTHNSVKKMIGCDVENLNVAIILTDIPYKSEYTYFVKMDDSGFCVSSIKASLHCYHFCNFGQFLGGGNFEKVRKDKNKKYFVIWQPNESKAPCTERKPDFSGRFDVVSHTCWNNKYGRSGISQIDVVERGRNGEKFTYKTKDPGYSEDLHQFIDKSGYFLEERRMDLRMRAQSLRNQREVAKVKEMDFSEEIAKAEKAFSEAKTATEKALSDSVNYDDFCKAASMARDLSWSFPRFERFKKDATEKSFASPEWAKSEFNRIMKELEKITK